MVFCCRSLSELSFSLKQNDANLCKVETYDLLRSSGGGGRWDHVGGVWVQQRGKEEENGVLSPPICPRLLNTIFLSYTKFFSFAS